MHVYQIALFAAAVLFASANAAMEVKQTEVSKANVLETPSWGRTLTADEGVAKRFLRDEKTTTEEYDNEEGAEEEERVLPGTDLAAKLAPKLEKVLSNKQLVTTTANKEWWQFAMWFIQGKSPTYVAENVLKINPLGSTVKGVAMYHRYVQYFQKYKFTGIQSVSSRCRLTPLIQAFGGAIMLEIHLSSRDQAVTSHFRIYHVGHFTSKPNCQDRMNFLETDRAVYFYGQRDAAFGFLSNFHPCEFTDAQGRRFFSSEQNFMKRKQEMFDPHNEQLSVAILRAKAPPVAKKLGRQVRNYDDEVWGQHRYEVMLEALKLKFSSDEELTAKLLATKDKRLYEASRRDAIWGIGLSVANVAKMFREDAAFRRTGDVSVETQAQCFGTNLLGNALMEARAWLRPQE